MSTFQIAFGGLVALSLFAPAKADEAAMKVAIVREWSKLSNLSPPPMEALFRIRIDLNADGSLASPPVVAASCMEHLTCMADEYKGEDAIKRLAPFTGEAAGTHFFEVRARDLAK